VARVAGSGGGADPPMPRRDRPAAGSRLIDW
jgi:hypothetical protein